jgi:hypothetical protein
MKPAVVALAGNLIAALAGAADFGPTPEECRSRSFD